MSAPSTSVTRIDIPVTGMTCASCANRIQRKLNKLDGVTAQVNYATETASIDYPAATVTIDALADTITAAGYTPHLRVEEDTDPDAEAAAQTRSLTRRFLIAVLFTAPVMALSMIPALQFDYWQWLVLALTTPVVVWCAWPFHAATWRNLRHATATMDTLVSLGISAAYLWSVAVMLLGDAGDPSMRMHMQLFGSPHDSDHIYFEAAAGVVTFLLLGRLLEARAKRAGAAAVRALGDLGAKDVRIRRADGTVVTRPIAALAVDDEFLTGPGEKLATDGVVIDGSGQVDEAMLTGESLPVSVAVGSQVTGATVLTSGSLVVRATQVGADTALAQLGRLVTAAQTGKAPVQRLVDTVSRVFVPVVLVISLIALGVHLLLGHGTVMAMTAAVAVLVIACPCALGLATPTALLAGTGRGAQLGILINGPEVLETSRKVSHIVLDKTGTLTTGEMQLQDSTVVADLSPAEALRIAAAVEAHSEHPIARALVQAAPSALTYTATDFTNTAGIGVSAVLDGELYSIARPQADDTAAVQAAVDAAEQRGLTAVVLSRGALTDPQRTPVAVFAIGDTLKDSASEAVAEFRALGLTPLLVTGDNPRAAAHIAAAVGITADAVHAGVLPADKVSVVADLQAAGHQVAMVGDGINDAAALAQADLGIAMGTGTDIAMAASDLTIMGGDIRQAADAVRLSRATLGIIRSNLFWAFAYNVILIPVAASGLLNPLMAGMAMAFSSVFVVTNSLRLRRFTPR